MLSEDTLRRRIKLLLAFFMAALIVSGLTAVPLEWEAGLLLRTLGPDSYVGGRWAAMGSWISTVHTGLTAVARDYPFLFYGMDWLAFAHLVIAIAFIGPYRDPVRNIWVIEFGLIACVLVIPLAMICGPIRGIPFFWRLIDCSFGVFGCVPLWLCRSYIKQLAALGQEGEAG